MERKDAYAALRIKDYRWFIYARFLLTFGIQMQSVIVGWQIYELTHDALSLGLIGLSEAIPFFCTTLFAGHVADIINRKRIILVSNFVYVICAVSLLIISTDLHPALAIYGAAPIYIIIFITGIARGFSSPASFALGAQLIPKELYGNASTWNSMTWHVSEITGPAIGGLVYGFFGVGYAYSLVTLFTTAGLIFFIFIKNPPMPIQIKKENMWQSLFNNQIILSAVSLDMFAVFFGGAVAVLPIFADQVLHVGAKGLGFLRAAPAVGSIIMSLVQAHYPPFEKAGRNLLLTVVGFG